MKPDDRKKIGGEVRISGTAVNTDEIYKSWNLSKGGTGHLKHKFLP